MKNKTDKLNQDINKMLLADPQLQIRLHPFRNTVSNLRGNLLKLKTNNLHDFEKGCLDFLNQHKGLFGEINTANLMKLVQDTDINGGKTVVWQQYHNKCSVEGGSIHFHVNKNGVIDSITNTLFPDLQSFPSISKIKLENAVLTVQKITSCYNEPFVKPVLLVFEHDSKIYLAWKIELRETKTDKNYLQRKPAMSSLHDHGAPHIWVSYVDALTGKLVFYYDNVQTAGPVLGNGTGYYSGAGTLNTYFNDITYQLRDLTRVGTGGPEIRTDDEDGASPSEDSNNNWDTLSTSPRDANQGAEVDAHRYAGNVIDYYRIVHGRNSFDGAGGTLRSVIHLGTDYNNGYWDGSIINLGDGTGVAATGDDYECSDDWLGHEMTHGYTQFTCGLIYNSESGALNEAFSDIMAAFITGDWLVFEDTWLKASAPAWRNMIDPTNGGLWNLADPINSVLAGHQPSHYSVRYTGASDNGGVHINSGIINNLFYLLTVGGTHTVSAITVTGIGQSPAEHMLWRCMSVNLVGNPNATFLDFRAAMLDACLDLFPGDLFKLSQVKNAFNAVGIGPDLYVRDNVADTGIEPFSGSYLWASPDIINKQNLVANPTVALANLADDTLWENVEFGQDNFIYIRVQNRGTVNGDATVNVYFSAATTFGTPASWIHIGAAAVTGIAQGMMKIAGPITFPSALIPSPGHYCMIAVINDALDPVPDFTLISSVGDYLNYVRNTNNIAYRNMDVIDVVHGVISSYSTWIRSIKGLREYYDIKMDLGKFIPGAKIIIKGDEKVLNGALTKGLKLIAREKGVNVYEILVGKNYILQRQFITRNAEMYIMEYGFEKVLVEKDFQIEIIFQVPEEKHMPLRSVPLAGYYFIVYQIWNGQAVGGSGIKIQAVLKKKLVDSK